MGFRKTHRRTKKRGGTRQRGGADSAAVEKAVTDTNSITEDSTLTDITPAITTLTEVIQLGKQNGVDVGAAETRLGQLQALAESKRTGDDSPEKRAEAVADGVDEKLFEEGEKKIFVENLARVLKTIYDNEVENDAALKRVVKDAFSDYNSVTNSDFKKCFKKEENLVNLIEDELVVILQRSNSDNPTDGLFHELKTQGNMGGGGKRRKTRRRRRRHGKKKAKKTHHKKKRKSRRKKRNTRRKRHY